MEMINAPMIKITGAAEARFVTTKNGQKQVFSQTASMTKEGMMLPIDIDLDTPADAYPVGALLVWDVSADVVPGQYGRLELARKKTLRAVETKSAQAAKA